MPKDKIEKMIAVTAPSGAGKTTIVKHLLKEYKELAFSVSATTRKKREHEVEGKDYYFLTPVEFKEKIKDDQFIEWEEVYNGQYYGTLKSEVRRLWDKGKYIVFDIDVKGATSLKSSFKEKCLAIFIQAPSLAILINRLKKRETETEESLRKRINRVKTELSYADSFDCIIVNDVLETTLKESELIIEDFLPIDN